MNYSLSIRLCADGFSFLVYSLGSGQLLLQESLPCAADETLADALERGLQLPRIAGRHYERVVLYSTSPSTRVPLDEFRREDMLAVYRLTFAEKILDDMVAAAEDKDLEKLEELMAEFEELGEDAEDIYEDLEDVDEDAAKDFQDAVEDLAEEFEEKMMDIAMDLY